MMYWYIEPNTIVIYSLSLTPVLVHYDMAYNPPQKSWYTLQYLSGNLSVRPLPPSSMLFIAMKLSLCVYNIWGRRGMPILVMSLGNGPQIPCQRIFVSSDPVCQGLQSWIVVLNKPSEVLRGGNQRERRVAVTQRSLHSFQQSQIH